MLTCAQDETMNGLVPREGCHMGRRPDFSAEVIDAACEFAW